MAKAPDLSPLALSLVDKLLAKLPASVSDLETWWGKQGKVTRLELVRLLRQLDGDRLAYDRDAGTVRSMWTRPAAMPGGSGHGGGVAVVKASSVATKAPTPEPDPKPASNHAMTAAEFRVVISHVGGVTFTGSAAAVKAAVEAYQRALLSPPTTPRPPAKRGPQPSAGSVSERVRASVCRKPGTVAEVIGRFPDVNENTIRGALGTLKAKGMVGHKGGKYGAPRG